MMTIKEISLVHVGNGHKVRAQVELDTDQLDALLSSGDGSHPPHAVLHIRETLETKEIADGADALAMHLDEVSMRLREITLMLESRPDLGRRLDAEQLASFRNVLDVGDKMHDVARSLAARINIRLPQLAMRLKKARRALDRVEGD